MHLVEAGKKNECAPICQFQDLHYLFCGGGCELRTARIRHLRRQVEQRLSGEIEVRFDLQFASRSSTEPLANEIEAPGRGESRRSEHNRFSVAKEPLRENCRDINRSGLKKQ